MVMSCHSTLVARTTGIFRGWTELGPDISRGKNPANSRGKSGQLIRSLKSSSTFDLGVSLDCCHRSRPLLNFEKLLIGSGQKILLHSQIERIPLEYLG